MGYDEVLLYLGDFGRYQKRIYLLLCLPAISCAFHKLAGVFLQAKVAHRCRLPDELYNATYDLPTGVLNVTIPWDSGSNSWSSCERYKTNLSYAQNNSVGNVIQCDDWIYDKSKYESSTVTEFNLVCQDAWLRATTDAVFMVGVLLGSIIFGDLSDRFGRRPIFFASLVIQVFAGVLTGFAPEYISYTIGRMIVGATTSGVFLVAYVIAMEMVGPSRRLFAGVGCQYFFSAGYMLTALFAYFLNSWRWLQIALSLPGLFFLSYWWCIPESVRWLLTKRRVEEAKQVLQKAADENKVTIPSEVLEGLLPELIDAEESNKTKETENNDKLAKIKKASLADLFKYPNLRKRAFIILFNWFVNSGTYYGLSWNTSNLGGNEYFNFLISGVVEIPAFTFLLLTLNRWGRKSILCSCLLVGGISLLLTLAVPANMNWLVVTFAMIGKLAITASYGTVYIFSAEQFPTVIRNAALGAGSTSARIGGILAPYVNLLADYWQPLPLVIFGALALTAGGSALLLPETMNRTLPDTIEDGENFGRSEEQKEHHMNDIHNSNPDECISNK